MFYHGKFYGYSPECGYPELCGEDDKERIIGVYGNNRVVNLGRREKQTIILNGTGVGFVEKRLAICCNFVFLFSFAWGQTLLTGWMQKLA